MKKLRKICNILLVGIFVISLNGPSFGRATKSRRRHDWLKRLHKKDTVSQPLRPEFGNFQNLERRFETIRDLGSIVRCRLHSDETTIVTGNSLICGGKRYHITPEAAKDAAVTTRQTISYANDGSPQDILSTIRSGLYAKPITSFLGESTDSKSFSGLVEPHSRYPYLGIYDKGMRNADPAFIGRSKATSLSYEDSLNDMSDGQMKNLGNMELNDISQAVGNGEGRENPDTFYRDSQLQNREFGVNGVKEKTSNPFAVYWKSLKNSFYSTTPSQLGETDPVGNSFYKTDQQAEVRGVIPRWVTTKLSTKKSSIQQKQEATTSQSRKEIPKPASDVTEKSKATQNTKDSSKKRYFILGSQQDRLPLGMFTGVPGIGPWQYRLNQEAMMRSGELMARQNPFRVPPAPIEPQPGSVRSFGGPNEWGTRASPRYYDPILAGSPVRVPMNPIFAQMRANEYTGEPGRPAKGRFQYGIQPGNGPPFLGFKSVPIMEAVPVNGMQAIRPDISDNREQDPSEAGAPDAGFAGGFERGMQNEQGGDQYSRREMPFNIERGQEAFGDHQPSIPGLIQESEQHAPETRGSVGLPMMNGGENFGQNGMEENLPQATYEQNTFTSRNSMAPQEDATGDFERMSGPENYVPAPFYRPPSYNPHETEQYFPDGTNDKFKEAEKQYLQKNGYTGPEKPYREEIHGSEGDAAELYQDESRQEQEQEEEEERKRGHLRDTKIDVNGNKIEMGSDGKFMYTKEHVGFGPITVEAKTARSGLKDPSDNDK